MAAHADRPAEPADRLRPYVAGLVVDWLQTMPEVRHRSIEGSLVFVDISGFTTLTERLAAKGKGGAEEMSDLLNASFATLLEEAYAYGALLVKWGGDAVLLLFEGPEHALLACRASYEMRRTMRRIGRLRTSVGVVQLRMSVGVDSGSFDFFVAGRRHLELLVAGPAATRTAVMEQTAEAGEIVVSPATAALLPPRCVGAAKGDGLLLRSAPQVDPRCRVWPEPAEPFDFGSNLDPAIRDHLVSEVGDSEHRQIAVGFVEVSGVDELLVQQGPGAVASALHDLLVLVQDECGRHQVTFWETDISKDGFKIMLVAGAPRSTGHDEDGMLRTARAILDGHHGPVRVRIGINSGRVFNGGFGPPFRRTWSVKGDAINLAARVMGKADTGQLLATETLLRRVSSRVNADLLPPFMVKGKAKPVRAAVVHEVGIVATDDSGPATAFIGRVEEVDRLLALLREADAGRGAAVAVTGAAGSGKTRLVRHVCSRLPGDMTVVRAVADAYEAATPYFVVRLLLRDLLGLRPDAPEPEVAVALRARVEALAAHLLPWLPLLGLPFGVHLDDTAETAAVQEQFRPQRVAALVEELLTVVCAATTVFVVDDVHAADDASVELLLRLSSAARQRRWALLLVGRTTPAAVAASGTVSALALPPLRPEDARAMVLAVDGGQGLASHDVRAIVDRAEGNPLFLQELTAATVSGAGGELPDTLEELLAAQLDELSPGQRQMLRAAAVLGTRFEERLAAQLLDRSGDTVDWSALGRFLAADGAGAWRFRTGLVRDTAYEGLPFTRRVDLHGRAAVTIEAEAAGRTDEVAQSLSLHYFNAQRFRPAWRYSRSAGDRARGLYANADALALYERARLSARRLPDLPADEVAELLESIGDVHARLAELDRATAAYREARRRAPATASVLRARVAISAGLTASRGGSMPRTMRWFSAAERDLDAAAADERAGELRARITVERALVRFRQGRHRESAALCRQALTEGEAAGADFVVGRALHFLDMNDLAVGRPGDEERVMRALELFDRCGDLTRQSGTWNHLGIRSYYAGDWDAAVERYDRARELHERAGDDWNAAVATGNIAEIRVDQGRLAEAEPLAAEVLRIWRASGTPHDIGFGAALMARLCARGGRHADAMVLLGESIDAYSAGGERLDVIDTQLRVVETLLLQGAAGAAVARLDEAEQSLRTALRTAGVGADDVASDAGLPADAPQATHVWRMRGYALAQIGSQDLAADLLSRAVASARARESAHDLALALDALAWLAPDAATVSERDELFAQLGIVWSPVVPRRAVEDVADAASIPRQRTAATAVAPGVAP